MEQRPSLGRNVFYIDEEGTTLASIIVFVHPDNIRVNLAVFDEEGTPFAALAVPFDIEGTSKPGTWAWPPRV